MTAPASGEASPVEAAAAALLAYETSGLCKLGKACDLCDCGMDMLSPQDRDVRTRQEVDRARHTLTAGLAGDWLERVLVDHSDWYIKGESTHDVIVYGCQGCTVEVWRHDAATDSSDLTQPRERFAAHQAAAIRAYATGGAA